MKKDKTVKLIVLDHSTSKIHVHTVDKATNKDDANEHYEDILLELNYNLGSINWQVANKLTLIVH